MINKIIETTISFNKYLKFWIMIKSKTLMNYKWECNSCNKKIGYKILNIKY